MQTDRSPTTTKQGVCSLCIHECQELQPVTSTCWPTCRVCLCSVRSPVFVFLSTITIACSSPGLQSHTRAHTPAFSAALLHTCPVPDTFFFNHPTRFLQSCCTQAPLTHSPADSVCDGPADGVSPLTASYNTSVRTSVRSVRGLSTSRHACS